MRLYSLWNGAAALDAEIVKFFQDCAVLVPRLNQEGVPLREQKVARPLPEAPEMADSLPLGSWPPAGG